MCPKTYVQENIYTWRHSTTHSLFYILEHWKLHITYECISYYTCLYILYIRTYVWQGRFVLHMVEGCSGPNPLWKHFPHTSNRKFLETSRVSENLTVSPKIASDSTSEEFTPTRPHPPPALQTLVKPPVYLLSFWLTSYRWVPNTPFLGSSNSVEQLTEFKELCYLLAYLFIIGGYNSGTTRCKRCMG